MARLVDRIRRKIRRLASLPRTAVVYSTDGRRTSAGPPIFVVGCMRSGTTLMRQILDSHSRIACPGETWFLIGLLEQLRNGFFVKGLEALDVYREEAVANIRAFALNYFERFLYRSGKARWADKTPGYVEYCPEILEVFGDARFVFMLRHGMDVAQSMQDRPWFGSLQSDLPADPLGRLQAAGRVWLRANDSFEAFQAKNPKVCHVVRFEDLTARPEPVMRGVLEFLGEPWEPAILSYQAFPHSGGGDHETAARAKIAPNSGNYRAWPEGHQRAMAEFLAPQLKRYGYSV